MPPSTALLALFLAGSSPSAPAVTAEIAGTWKGTSTCVDRVAAPACNDEVVIYEIVPAKDKPGVVTWTADKVVGGERGPMGGAIDLKREAEGRWAAESENRRHERMHWVLTVKGEHMDGILELLPGKTVIRRMKLEREGAGPSPKP